MIALFLSLLTVFSGHSLGHYGYTLLEQSSRPIPASQRRSIESSRPIPAADSTDSSRPIPA